MVCLFVCVCECECVDTTFSFGSHTGSNMGFSLTDMVFRSVLSLGFVYMFVSMTSSLFGTRTRIHSYGADAVDGEARE